MIDMKKINEMHPYDLSNEFKQWSKEEQIDFCKKAKVETLADMFSYIDNAHEYFNQLDDNLTAMIISQMESDDAADVLNQLDDDMLNLIDKDTLEASLKLLEYNDDEAGSIMDLDCVKINPDMDVKDAMKVLIKEAPLVKTITTLFVVENEKLLGILDFRKLISTKSPALIKDIMNDQFYSVNSHTNIEETLELIKDYDINILPVLDDGILKGIITPDDALYTKDEENLEDYTKFSAITENEDVDDQFMKSVQKRFPWLLTLLLLDVFVCLIMVSFSNIIESLTVLVLFQPMILGLAGNAGTQSLAIAIRNIGDNELNNKNKVQRHLFKEIRIGLLTGIILGMLCFVIIGLFLMIKGEVNPFIISGVISLSMFVSLGFATFFGALLPIFFNYIHIDPAVASGPFITTINDILAMIIYFSLAGSILMNI